MYISIPITGMNEEEQRRKVEKVMESMEEYVCINPFFLSDSLTEIFSKEGKSPGYEDFLEWDLYILSFCDAIFLCKGWEKSHGCRIEKAFAEAIGLKIMYQ